MTTGNQTALELTNGTGQEVQVFLTLGATPGCVQNVADIPFVTNVVNTLQGSFTLAANGSVSYTPPAGVGVNGNFSFGTPPINCPTDAFPDGVNLAEFILNNSFQGPGAQETIDISAVAGVNAFLKFSMTGGGVWNAGSTEPNVTEFENKGLHDNCGQVGVYPYGCDNCTQRANPPQCDGPPTPPPYGDCQSAPICNVQRDASTAGGTVSLSFLGFA
ncbi:MAG TPA: hypothetical protein VF546_21060 [Pyrinomonadaceae bacterium]|jgi:hypothetical protein